MFHEFRVSEEARSVSEVQVAINQLKYSDKIVPVICLREEGAGVRYLAPYGLVAGRLEMAGISEHYVGVSAFRGRIKSYWEEPSHAGVYVIGARKQKDFAFFGEAARQKMEACGVVAPEPAPAPAPAPLSNKPPEADDVTGEPAQNIISIYESMGLIPSDHQAMRAMYGHLSLVAPTPLTVLLCGETGTGKEGLAEALHRASSRHDKPFYTLNCAAMNKDLVRAELFGHKKGAFTGAYRSSDGIISCADEGTLFIDEIHHMPTEGQQALLRFLDSGEYSAVGDEKVKKADVRIVAATNQTIKGLVNSGSFLKDLFYRLDQFTAHILPLRERRQDVTKLSQHFAQAFAKAIAYEKPPEITFDAQCKILEHKWPGNVRELSSAMARAVTFSQGRPIKPEHVILTQGINLNGTITPMPAPVLSHCKV